MKNFKQLFLLCTVVLSLASCSNDDTASPTIIGKWKYVGYKEAGTFYEFEGDCNRDFLTINEDGTLTVSQTLCSNNQENSNPYQWKYFEGDFYYFGNGVGSGFDLSDTRPNNSITFPEGSNKMYLNQIIYNNFESDEYTIADKTYIYTI